MDGRAAQRDGADAVEAEAILGTCVKYGFCTNTCPTYVLTRDENESPRGRIELIRQMLASDAPPRASTIRHLDSCLSCLSCMTTCAVRVDYGHLIDHARHHIETHARRPIGQRIVRGALARILPRPRAFAAALALGRRTRPLHGALPAGLRPLTEALPVALDTRIVAPGTYPAEGERRRRVALLAGCAQQVLRGEINAATLRVLRRSGCEVVVPEAAGCCGSLTLHMGRKAEAMDAARRNVAAWDAAMTAGGLDAIVVNASGCGTTVKDYGHLLRDDPAFAERAARVAGLARDVSELLAEIGLPASAPQGYRVAYHDPCSMQHGQRVTREPRALLRRAGFEVADVPEAHFCCGSAGTYNLLQPAMADTLGRRKAGHLASTEADLVATGNIGCMMQIGRYSRLPVVHTVQLVDWANGGPRPPELAGLAPRPIAPPPEPDPAPSRAPVAQPPSSTDDLGIW